MNQNISLVGRIINGTSSSQKYWISNAFFILPFLLLSILILKDLKTHLTLLDFKIAGLTYQEPLREIFTDVLKRQLIDQSIDLSDKKTPVVLKNEIDTLFDNLNKYSPLLQDHLSKQENTSSDNRIEHLAPIEMQIEWERIKEIEQHSMYSTDSIYKELINDLKTFIKYTGETFRLVLEDELKLYYAVDQTIFRLPERQALLSQLFLLMKNDTNRPLDFNDRMQLALLIGRLRENIDDSNRAFVNLFIDQSELKNSEAFNANQKDLKKLEEFLTYLNNQDLTKQNLIYSTALLSKGISVFESQFFVWEDLDRYIIKELKVRRSQLKTTYFSYLAAAFILYMIGFLLSSFFIKHTIQSIQDLFETSKKLAAGELSARMPVQYNDEISQTGIQFNAMADSFQKVEQQLHHLVESIKSLAKGDFTVRTAVIDPTTEIGQVALSFNHMAQNFEQIISHLHQLGIRLTSSANQLYLASTQQVAVTQEQEKTTFEISSASDHISTTATSLAKTMDEVNQVVEYTSSLAKVGQENLVSMETTMDKMVTASNLIASKLSFLNEKAKNITSVITTITKVADQTNLLSLNAAIEAERAGEFGKSFKIIAQEIRRLADQTAFATLNIEKMVNEILNALLSSVTGINDFTQAIHTGVNEVARIKTQLTNIIQEVHDLSDQFTSLNIGMQSQSSGAQQINHAISELGKTAQYTTESIYHFGETIQQLNGEAKHLIEALTNFKDPYKDNNIV